MKKLFELQEAVQHAMVRKGKVSRLSAFGLNSTVGDVYDYVSQLRFFIEEEISELLEELGNGSRDIHKPWKELYAELRHKDFVSTVKIREEAIDGLCFMVNLCLAVGLTPDNIDEEYLLVHKKVLGRLGDEA